ncbi:MAG: DUF3787 domain-containing protein [Clostridia bacterium]|jgi:hypothetical protein|nr:DUF3787 domain-containing protein [Clostridia bacterium]
MPEKIVANTQQSLKKLDYAGLYQTHALADAKNVDPANNVSKPSDKNVDEARNWVNTNEK